MTKACSVYRKANNLTVHPSLENKEGSANRAQVENGEEIFGSHPDDSIEVLSEADNSLNQPDATVQSGLSACHVSMSGTLLSDDEEYTSDVEHSSKPSSKRLNRSPIPAQLRQSRQGRKRAKVGAPTGKVHGRIQLSEYSMSASSKEGAVPAYSLMV